MSKAPCQAGAIVLPKEVVNATFGMRFDKNFAFFDILAKVKRNISKI